MKWFEEQFGTFGQLPHGKMPKQRISLWGEEELIWKHCGRVMTITRDKTEVQCVCEDGKFVRSTLLVCRDDFLHAWTWLVRRDVPQDQTQHTEPAQDSA